jgi:hypothetical protein
VSYVIHKEKYDGKYEIIQPLDFRKPVCQRDFCDRCGDCLNCYGEDPCKGVEGLKHMWVVNENTYSR